MNYGQARHILQQAKESGQPVSVTCQIYGHVVGACAECNTHSEVEDLQKQIDEMRAALSDVDKAFKQGWDSGFAMATKLHEGLK